jgi:hypothetical protein
LAKLAALAGLIVVLIASPAAAAEPEIRTDDVDRFYRVYAAANGRPTAEVLQRDYLDHASPGLVQLAKVRNITAERMAKADATADLRGRAPLRRPPAPRQDPPG